MLRHEHRSPGPWPPRPLRVPLPSTLVIVDDSYKESRRCEIKESKARRKESKRGPRHWGEGNRMALGSSRWNRKQSYSSSMFGVECVLSTVRRRFCRSIHKVGEGVFVGNRVVTFALGTSSRVSWVP